MLICPRLPYPLWAPWGPGGNRMFNNWMMKTGMKSGTSHSVLVSLRYRMIQFKIVQRAYNTPSRLLMMNTSHSPECWRRGQALGDFTQAFWTSPPIVEFWKEALTVIYAFVLTQFPLVKDVHLLGLVDNLILTTYFLCQEDNCLILEEKAFPFHFLLETNN